MFDANEDADDSAQHHSDDPDQHLLELDVLEQVLAELDADDRFHRHAQAVYPGLRSHALTTGVCHVAVVLPVTCYLTVLLPVTCYLTVVLPETYYVAVVALKLQKFFLQYLKVY